MGINLHLHRSVIVRIDERGQQLDCVQVDNDPKALVREVRRSPSTWLRPGGEAWANSRAGAVILAADSRR